MRGSSGLAWSALAMRWRSVNVSERMRIGKGGGNMSEELDALLRDRDILNGPASPQTEQRKVVTAFPENSETPLESVQSWVTPNRLFFVRNHFDVPTIH